MMDRQIAEYQATQDRLKERMATAKARERALLKESRRQKGHVSKKPRLDHLGDERSNKKNDADDEFLPVDRVDSVASQQVAAEDGISVEVRALMNQ